MVFVPGIITQWPFNIPVVASGLSGKDSRWSYYIVFGKKGGGKVKAS